MEYFGEALASRYMLLKTGGMANAALFVPVTGSIYVSDIMSFASLIG